MLLDVICSCITKMKSLMISESVMHGQTDLVELCTSHYTTRKCFVYKEWLIDSYGRWNGSPQAEFLCYDIIIDATKSLFFLRRGIARVVDSGGGSGRKNSVHFQMDRYTQQMERMN